MWEVKHFKTKKAMDNWLSRHKVQWEIVFVDNVPYAIIYRPLRKIL